MACRAHPSKIDLNKNGYQSKRPLRISILMPKGSEKQEMKILPLEKEELSANQCQPICPWLAGWPAWVSW